METRKHDLKKLKRETENKMKYFRFNRSSVYGVLQTCEDSLEEIAMFQFKAVSQRRVLVTDFNT